jgi:hypothetical protein
MKLTARLLVVSLAFGAALAVSAGSFGSFGVAAAATHHHARSHHAGPSYPMKADEFRALMEKRIDGIRGVIDRKLDKRGVSADRKKAIHKIFDEASRDLRAEIDHAAADGTVTQGEADKVKVLATGLRGKVRERLRAEKDPAAREKIAHEDAAKAAKKDKPGAASGSKAHDKGKKPGDLPKTSEAKTSAAKAKPSKKSGDHPGPTKPAKAATAKTAAAKASTGKKRRAAQADPGANL